MLSESELALEKTGLSTNNIVNAYITPIYYQITTQKMWQRKTNKMENKNTLWSKLSAPQLREAIEMFRSEQDSDNEHLSFDEYQSVVNVVALADWIEWEYSEILMVRQEQEYIWEQEVKDAKVN